MATTSGPCAVLVPRLPDPVGLIFDLDGTLIDSAPDIHATANKVLGAEGLAPFAFETVKGFIGNGVGVLVARLLMSRGLPGSGPDHARLVAAFINTYEEAVDLTTLYPNVLQALDALSGAGHPMAICTNKPARPALAVLRHFGLERYFPVIIGGDTLAQRKPDAAPLLHARAALGCPDVLFIGDSEVDAETAAAARVAFVLFTEGYRKTAPEALGASAVFDDFAALPALVRGLTAG